MRNLSIAVLLCSSFLLAQDLDDYSAEESSVAEESVSEPEPAVEDGAPAEEAASEESVAEESTESSEEVAEAPAIEEPVAEEPAVAEAPAEEPAAEEAKLGGAEVEIAPAKEPSIAPIYVPKSMTPEQRVAAIENDIATLSNHMESTLLGKDDAPLAVSGYMAFRVKNFEYTEIAPV